MIATTLFVMLALSTGAVADPNPARFGVVRRAGAAVGEGLADPDNDNEVLTHATGEVLAGAPVNNITVTASNVMQCSQAYVSWTNAVPPVSLMIGTGGYYVGVTQLMTINNLQDSSSWYVDQPAGTSLIFQVTDGDGQLAYAQNIQVQGSDDGSCLASGSGGASGASETVSSTMDWDSGSMSQTWAATTTAAAYATTKSSKSSTPDSSSASAPALSSGTQTGTSTKSKKHSTSSAASTGTPTGATTGTAKSSSAKSVTSSSTTGSVALAAASSKLTSDAARDRVAGIRGGILVGVLGIVIGMAML